MSLFHSILKQPSSPIFSSPSSSLLAFSINRFAPSISSTASFFRLPSLPLPHPLFKSSIRTNVMRPRRLAHRKAHKGFFKVNSGGSLAGTVPYYGDFGLQVACMGGRLEDRQLENARTAIRRVIKAEKGSKMFLRTFPDRPVTSKGSEARMGKGKGAFDYHAKWVSEGAIIFEVSGVRRETAAEAMRVAGAVLPVHTRMVESPSIAAGGVGGGVGGGVDGNVVMHSRVAPRCLPHFIKKKLDAMEFQRFQRKSPEAPSITETVISTMTTTGTDVAAN